MIWWSAWVGAPFADGGRGPAAFDCWGLVRDVLAARAGIALPVYGEVPAAHLAAVARALRAGAAAEEWRAVHVPAPLDVVLMRSPRGGAAVVHVGVMVEPARMLHVEEAAAVVAVGLDHWSVRGRVLGFRRHRALEVAA